MKEFFMKEALKEAKLAYRQNEIPVGAVIVKDEKIISRGHNLKERFLDPTMHAEMIAIRAGNKILDNWWLEDCDMYVSLEPCPMCAGAILNARMRRVYIAAKDPKMGACGGNIDLSHVSGFNHSFGVEFGIMEKESQLLLGEFFKNLRKINANIQDSLET